MKKIYPKTILVINELLRIQKKEKTKLDLSKFSNLESINRTGQNILPPLN